MQTKNQNLIDDLIEWLIYISVFLVPIVFVPQLASVFTTPKLYVFRAVTLVILVLFALKLLLNKKVKIKWSFALWFFVLYGFVSILNTVFSINVWDSIFGIYGRFVGIVTVLNLLLWSYIVFLKINTRKKILNVLNISIVTAVLVSVYGILQYSDLFVNIFYWTQDPLKRAFATIGHSNHTAAYLGINFVILIGLIRISSFGWRKVLYWMALILLAIALVLTGSRGGVFAVIVVVILWLIYGLRTRRFKKDLKQYGKFILFIITILFIAGLIFRTQIRSLPIISRSISTVNYIEEGNIPDRISWWFSSFEMIKDKPIFGYGLSTYRDVYNKYRRTDFVTPDDRQDVITPQSAHNEYLTIASTQGFVGLFAYLLMIIMTFVYTKKSMNNTKDQVLAYSIAMGITVYLVQVFVSFGVVSILFVFYTLLGLLLSVSHINKTPKEYKIGLIVRSIGVILILIFVIVGSVFSFFSLVAEYHYEQAKSNNIEDAFSHYKKAILYMPYISQYYEGYGDFLFKLGIDMPEGAQEPYLLEGLANYQKSLDLNDLLPHLHMNRGLIYSRLAVEVAYRDTNLSNIYKDIAIQSLEDAIKRTRNNPLYVYKKAEMLEFYKRYDEAYEQYQKVLKIRNPYKDTEEKIKELNPNLTLPVHEEGTN